MGTVDSQSQHALTKGTILNDTYEVVRVLGEGGFGITYEGITKIDEKKVTIKEYYPTNYALREHADSDMNLHIFRGSEEKYNKGLKRFIKEAEVLKAYQYIEGVVSVLDFFECNNTAYIVMEYIEGITLKQYVEFNGVLFWDESVELFAPIMKAMGQLHKNGLIHRDISPDNLLIGLDNKARLIDFGAANQLGEEHTHTQTVILKNGYAPPEQYLKEGKLGSWTDVYALSATMFMAMTGRTPTDSVARLQGTELPVDLLELSDCKEWQKQALLKGLDLKVSNRYKTMADFYGAITVEPLAEDQTTSSVEKEVSTVVERQLKNMVGENTSTVGNQSLKRVIGIVLGIVILLGLVVVIFSQKWFVGDRNVQHTTTTTASVSTTSTQSTSEQTTSTSTTEQIITTQVHSTEKAQTTQVTTVNTTQEPTVKQNTPKETPPKSSVKVVADDEELDSFKLGD